MFGQGNEAVTDLTAADAWRLLKQLQVRQQPDRKQTKVTSQYKHSTLPMKATTSSTPRFAALLCGCALLLGSAGYAKQGATDPIPGTSNGTTSSGGGTGGSKSRSTTTTTTTASTTTTATNTQPLITATLNFTAAAEVNGVIPVCTGAYRIDPYYPTLSLMTVSVDASSVNVSDNTVLYVTVNGANGTLYPFTSNGMAIVGGSGQCTYSVYVTPGTTITSVLVTDASGAIISAGQ
jgi:hypothetical protein